MSIWVNRIAVNMDISLPPSGFFLKTGKGILDRYLLTGKIPFKAPPGIHVGKNNEKKPCEVTLTRQNEYE